jgi:hypothetical protein
MKIKKMFGEKIITLSLVLSLVLSPLSALASVSSAVDYLKSQTPDAWTTQALVVSGETGMNNDHLKTVVGVSTPEPASTDYARTILALASVGKNPANFGSEDYIAKLKTFYINNQMGDEGLFNDDAWSILALASVGQADSMESQSAKNFLLANQNSDGGWGWMVGGGSDTDDTAAIIMALVETGMSSSDSVVVNALDYLSLAQNADGGFPNDPVSPWGTDSNSNSDALVISALYKVGQDPATWDKEGNNPITNLNSLQDVDGGFWWANPENYKNTLSTAQAVIALSGKSYPVGYYEAVPLKLSIDQLSLNSGETSNITVEYFDGENWLGLEGATVLASDKAIYTTDSEGKITAELPSGKYLLLAEKNNYLSSEPTEVEVITVSNAGGGGGGFFFPLLPNLGNNQEDIVDTESENKTTEIKIEEVKTEEVIIEQIEPVEVKVLGVEYKKNITPEEQISLEAQDINQNIAISVVIQNTESVATQNLVPADFDKHIKALITDKENLTQEQIKTISDFINYGTTSVQKLGAGERASLLNSYKSIFEKLPTSTTEWEDVLKIGNGLTPSQVINNDQAKADFVKIYKKEVDLNNAQDKLVIDMMVYGLKTEVRNLDQEKIALKKFQAVYGTNPNDARTWNILQAIAYAGE